MILDGLKEWSKSKGITELRLDVYDANDSAIRAYEKAGFQRHLLNMRIRIGEEVPFFDFLSGHDQMKYKITELLLTFLIGTWCVYRLSIDARSYITPGWHTEIETPLFMKIKIFGVFAVLLFFIWRIYQLSRSLTHQKGN